MGMAAEFKDFVMKGNVVDMAVGVVIGGAFGKIVSSMVGDVIMPPIGKFMGGVNFADIAMNLGAGADGKDVLVKYGAFFQTVIDFLIIALVIFLAIKGLNKMKKPDPAAPPPPPPKQEVLLEEIRNLLARR